MSEGSFFARLGFGKGKENIQPPKARQAADLRTKAFLLGLGAVGLASSEKTISPDAAHVVPTVEVEITDQKSSAENAAAPDNWEEEQWQKSLTRNKAEAEQDREEEEKIRQVVFKEWGIDIDNIYESSRARFKMFIVNPFDQYIVAGLREFAKKQVEAEQRKKLSNLLEETKQENAIRPSGLAATESFSEVKQRTVEETAAYIDQGNKALSHISYGAPTEEDVKMMSVYDVGLKMFLRDIGIKDLSHLAGIDFETSMALQTEPFRGHLEKIIKAIVSLNQRFMSIDKDFNSRKELANQIVIAEKILTAIQKPKYVSGK